LHQNILHNTAWNYLYSWNCHDLKFHAKTHLVGYCVIAPQLATTVGSQLVYRILNRQWVIHTATHRQRCPFSQKKKTPKKDKTPKERPLHRTTTGSAACTPRFTPGPRRRSREVEKDGRAINILCQGECEERR
jgi:hypothetical protein